MLERLSDFQFDLPHPLGLCRKPLTFARKGVQPRQHEADQSDGVFKSLETLLEDHPRPEPTDRRLAWLARLPGLCREILATLASRASAYFLSNGFSFNPTIHVTPRAKATD
jgi:hypothetical protein